WTSAVLAQGKTVVPVSLRAGSGARTDYEITVERSLARQAYLKGTGAGSGALFGAFASGYGDTLVVGAPSEADGGMSDVGAAYVFVREDSGWRLQQRLGAEGGSSDDLFGVNVAIWGDKIAVGAPGNIFSSLGPSTRMGKVYVFGRSGDSWTLEQTLTLPSDANGGTGFGFSLSLHENTLLVGAPLDDSGARASGAAYVFEYDGTEWQRGPQLKAPTPVSDSDFGTMLSVNRDTIAISAWREAVSGNSRAGAVYTYRRGPEGWTHEARLQPPSVRAQAYFGGAILVRGDFVVVAAPSNPPEGSGSSNRSGEVHVFERTGAEYRVLQTLAASQPAVGDRFGNHMAATDDALIIGAPGASSSRNGAEAAGAGAAFLYARTPEGFVRT
ncbi:MAG TPA: hypothetical protein VMF89_24110, partial [Polyangiales bacterium]|nr:hypothetical protein [Polyangiales bacterium]